ncbi:hypothetical protein L195_g057665 [Trifolium pratense]|uniref:Uncharacterized protein n=1 Tax=Trifolium pratense TaxID=57577 RepID=A0A2K3KWP1_TRIPR|nr:hypothetical protein L195_g057665 [Trifolium pratense]
MNDNIYLKRTIPNRVRRTKKLDLKPKQKITTTVHGDSLNRHQSCNRSENHRHCSQWQLWERNQPKRKSPYGDQLIRVRWCRNRERVDRTSNSCGYGDDYLIRDGRGLGFGHKMWVALVWVEELRVSGEGE